MTNCQATTTDWPVGLIEAALIVREALGCEVTLAGRCGAPEVFADIQFKGENFWTEVRTDGALWRFLVAMCREESGD